MSLSSIKGSMLPCANIHGSSISHPLSLRTIGNNWKERANQQILKMAAPTINGKDCRATTVCVTGASGYVGSWLVKRLLDQGYIVHATKRYIETEEDVRHLRAISGAEERLKIFSAELSEDGSFDPAITGCDGVFHVATPTELTSVDPENDVIKPAVDGTLSVLRACTKAKTVKRVVVTSSATTVAMSDQDGFGDELRWTDVDFLRTEKPPVWSYSVSKILAEQAAFQYGKEHDLNVVSILPVLVAGASITPAVPGSVQLALSPLTGIPHQLQSLKRMPSFPLIHVDDLCSAHIFLMENPALQGRYICSAITISVQQLAQYLSKRYPQYNVLGEFGDFPANPTINPSSRKLLESGFSFKFGLDEIFDDAVQHLKNKGVLN